MIYLASTSPRRKTLLKEAGIRFRALRPRYHEKPIAGLKPFALVKVHAFEKARSVVPRVKNGVILSVDSIVYFHNQVIGKPRNLKEAFSILSRLQGQWQAVCSGVAILKVRAGRVTKKKVFHVKTRVFLKKMSAQEIHRYFKKINPLDKAGAFALQSRGPFAVSTKIRGSFSNAVGLPMEKLKQVLTKF